MSGVLIIHGFTANLESVRRLFQPIMDLGVKVHAPLLKGHGQSTPDALSGTGWKDWLADAEAALHALAGATGKIIVIGHSMGALLALQLAVRHPETIDALVLATPPFKLVSLLAPGRPMHFLAPIISFLVKRWELRTTLADRDPALKPNQYTWAPTDAIISFFELIAETEPILDKINLPVLILHNRQDSVVLPESGDYVYHHIASSPERKSILWLDRSDHQLFCDCERVAAVGAVVEFIALRLKGSPVFPQIP